MKVSACFIAVLKWMMWQQWERLKMSVQSAWTCALPVLKMSLLPQENDPFSMQGMWTHILVFHLCSSLHQDSLLCVMVVYLGQPLVGWSRPHFASLKLLKQSCFGEWHVGLMSSLCISPHFIWRLCPWMCLLFCAFSSNFSTLLF